MTTDKWAEKIAELEATYNFYLKKGFKEMIVKYAEELNQLCECKKWHDEQLEEHTQRCAKDMIQQNYMHHKDLKEAFEKKRDEELEEIAQELKEEFHKSGSGTLIASVINRVFKRHK